MELGFLLKKIMAAFCMPLPLAAMMLFLGLLLWRQGVKAAAKVLAVSSVIFVYVVSIHPTAEWMAANLERQYPAYPYQADRGVDYVLVLGSAHVSDDSQPITSFLSNIGLARLMEGVRIYRLHPGSKLLFSGYAGRDQMSHAQALQAVAKYLGVPEQDMILQAGVKDTGEEASYWVDVVQNKSLVIVTSATHMPRAMYLFQQAINTTSYQPILYAGPTDYISHSNSPLNWDSWFPSGKYLYRVERAWHEYLGLAWAKLNS
jgi:uncharacterized SAM-binding protein YcdF (DUF218 family)